MTEETAQADVNPRVLVVEDEEIVRDILLKVLTEEGYRVDAVETGEEGLKALDSSFARGSFSAIVCSIRDARGRPVRCAVLTPV